MRCVKRYGDISPSAVTEAVGNIVEKWEMTYRSLEHLIDDTRPQPESFNSEELEPTSSDDKVNDNDKYMNFVCNLYRQFALTLVLSNSP